MSSDEIIIDVKNLSKCYEIYAKPRDRLKQLVIPSIYNLLARTTGLFRHASNESSPPRYFREFWALHNVSFQVKKGETLGIVGRNGSGKSTLLQLICSTLAPTSGEVIVKGRISALLELGSGFNPEYTGRENVFLNGQILGLSQKDIESRYDAIVEFADIGSFIDQPVKTYSSGMAVRLAFAVAINVDPEILVVDEALAVGDVGFQARCFAKIEELKQQGVTLLFVSHSPGAIVQLCNRTILLDSGELLLNGAPYQTISAYNYLASAGPASFHDIRREIVTSAEVENSNVSIIAHGRKLLNQTNDPAADSTSTFEAYFDTQLNDAIKPLPFERRGGEIIDISINDLSGRTVNVLPMHHKFTLKFNVRLDSGFDNVRVAWVIKTMNGLILGGGSTHQPGSGIRVPGATSFLVTSHFINIFVPGDYLIDIGVRGKIEKDDEFICAITNAIAVRSVSYNLDYRNGVVDCLVNPFFTLESNTDKAMSFLHSDLRINSQST